MKKSASLIVSMALLFVCSLVQADVPMKAWGNPSLQGNWDFRTVTPFQRPAAFADKEFLTPEEVEDYEAAVRVGREARASAEFDGEYDDENTKIIYEVVNKRWAVAVFMASESFLVFPSLT